MDEQIKTINVSDTIRKWLSANDNTEMEKVILANRKLPNYKENRHKKYLALVGIFLFPAMNIFLSHKGIMKISEILNFHYYIAFVFSVLIPVIPEYAQFTILKPMCKRNANGEKIGVKDIFDVAFFSLLILVATGWGIYTIASQNTNMQSAIVISLVFSSFFLYMTIYSHISLSNFFAISARELKDLNPDVVDYNFIELENLNVHYKQILNNLIELPTVGSVSIPITAQTTTQEENPPTQVVSQTNVVSEKPPVKVGFVIPNTVDKNDNRNETRNAQGKRKCQHCGKDYFPNHNRQVYCSTECRQNSWEIRTGKKLIRKG